MKEEGMKGVEKDREERRTVVRGGGRDREHPDEMSPLCCFLFGFCIQNNYGPEISRCLERCILGKERFLSMSLVYSWEANLRCVCVFGRVAGTHV